MRSGCLGSDFLRLSGAQMGVNFGIRPFNDAGQLDETRCSMWSGLDGVIRQNWNRWTLYEEIAIEVDRLRSKER